MNEASIAITRAMAAVAAASSMVGHPETQRTLLRCFDELAEARKKVLEIARIRVADVRGQHVP